MLSWRQTSIVVTGLVLAFAIVPRARASDKSKMPEPEPFGRFTVDQVERRLGPATVPGPTPRTISRGPCA